MEDLRWNTSKHPLPAACPTYTVHQLLKSFTLSVGKELQPFLLPAEDFRPTKEPREAFGRGTRASWKSKTVTGHGHHSRRSKRFEHLGHNAVHAQGQGSPLNERYPTCISAPDNSKKSAARIGHRAAVVKRGKALPTTRLPPIPGTMAPKSTPATGATAVSSPLASSSIRDGCELRDAYFAGSSPYFVAILALELSCCRRRSKLFRR